MVFKLEQKSYLVVTFALTFFIGTKSCDKCKLYLFKYNLNKNDGKEVYMQKISLDVLEKMMQSNLSSKEVDFILYIAQYQNQFGIARGIYYKDLCDTIDLSYQGFYNCKTSLEDKGIIACEKNSYYDYDITILNNSFDGEDYRRGYVNIHIPMVRDPRFQRMKAGAKLMALWLLREWRIYKKQSKSSSYKIGRDNFFAKFRELMGLSNRCIRSYLGALKPFLNIYLEDGRMYYLTFREEYVRTLVSGDSENGELRSHMVRVACRRNRIKSDPAKEKEIYNILSMHEKELRKLKSFSLTGIIDQTLQLLNQGVRSKYKWKRYLNPALIHQGVLEYV